jgi:SAM-dependent methyltransferase
MDGQAAARRPAKQVWEESFDEQVRIQAYNTAPVEAVVRTVAYHLRGAPATDRVPHYLEMGCGAGPNLIWLAQKGIRVSGVDIAPTALRLARQNLTQAGHEAGIEALVEASVCDVPLAGGTFDGIVEACVFQHLNKVERVQAFREVYRLLRPGGMFVGYMLSRTHSIFEEKQALQLSDDPGTLVLADGRSKVYLTNIGLSHFFDREEYFELLKGFTVVDPCATSYDLPQAEARRRGYDHYHQGMWTVYAVK